MDVNEWVQENGYANLDEWMEDSDYHWTGDGWIDDLGTPVDPTEQAHHAMEASLA